MRQATSWSLVLLGALLAGWLITYEFAASPSLAGIIPETWLLTWAAWFGQGDPDGAYIVGFLTMFLVVAAIFAGLLLVLKQWVGKRIAANAPATNMRAGKDKAPPVKRGFP